MLPLLFCLMACTDKVPDDTGTPPGQWTVLGENLSSGLLSITGTATDDVWTVGGDTGAGPLVLHYDGSTWTPIDTGSTGDLWWVWLDGEETWMVGADSRVLTRHADGTLSELTLEVPGLTLFGIWGSGPSDIWTVGGDINVASNGAHVFHYDGSTWTDMTLPEDAASKVAMYKVWGSGPSDVWIVGGGGVVLHWDGAAWTSVGSDQERTLFTVAGDDGGVYAVGGQISGTILHYDGSAWIDETPELASQQNGVAARSGCSPASVGIGGSVYNRGDAGWAADDRAPGTFLDLHGVWIDPDCAVWAVGGAITSSPLRQGVVLYGGSQGIEPISL